MTTAFDVDVDVIQVAHHGSKYATCASWLTATSPEAAFIPVGTNSYGHPTQEVLDRLGAASVATYRTDIMGTITFTSDGTTWSVELEKPVDAPPADDPEPTPTEPEPTSPAPTTPTGGSGGVTISHIEYDPPGDDKDANLVNEYVEITNAGSTAVVLTGWLLKDAAVAEYHFPAFTLGSGASVKVRTGHGSDSATDLYWNRGLAVWNQDHDTATLHDDAGNVVDSQGY